MNLDEKQKEIIDNKRKHGWEIGNIEHEFCLLYTEVGEAFDAYIKNKSDLGSELADVAIYLLGISEMLGFSLQDEIQKKMEINSHRVYEVVNGELTKHDDRE